MISFTIQSFANTIRDIYRLIKNNTKQIQNAIFKPTNLPSYEYDVLSQTNTTGVFNYRTPNNGVVKFIGIAQGLSFSNNETKQIVLAGNVSEVFSSVTNFPKNISNQFPGQDPIANKSTFLPFLYNSSSDTWLENPLEHQVHLWRVQINYTRQGTQGNRELILRFTNTVSGFQVQEVKILPNGSPFQTNTITYQFITIADSSSITNGYELELQTVGVPLTINTLEISRVSFELL